MKIIYDENEQMNHHELKTCLSSQKQKISTAFIKTIY